MGINNTYVITYVDNFINNILFWRNWRESNPHLLPWQGSVLTHLNYNSIKDFPVTNGKSDIQILKILNINFHPNRTESTVQYSRSYLYYHIKDILKIYQENEFLSGIWQNRTVVSKWRSVFPFKLKSHNLVCRVGFKPTSLPCGSRFTVCLLQSTCIPTHIPTNIPTNIKYFLKNILIDSIQELLWLEVLFPFACY